jgi:hypothetical protein
VTLGADCVVISYEEQLSSYEEQRRQQRIEHSVKLYARAYAAGFRLHPYSNLTEEQQLKFWERDHPEQRAD